MPSALRKRVFEIVTVVVPAGKFLFPVCAPVVVTVSTRVVAPAVNVNSTRLKVGSAPARPDHCRCTPRRARSRRPMQPLTTSAEAIVWQALRDLLVCETQNERRYSNDTLRPASGAISFTRDRWFRSHDR